MSDTTITFNCPAVPASTGGTGALAGLPQATLQQFLASAQNALNAVLTGQQATIVTYASGEGTRSVTYSRTNETALRRYIAELQAALGMPTRGRAIRPGYGRMR